MEVARWGLGGILGILSLLGRLSCLIGDPRSGIFFAGERFGYSAHWWINGRCCLLDSPTFVWSGWWLTSASRFWMRWRTDRCGTHVNRQETASLTGRRPLLLKARSAKLRKADIAAGH
jgi:hypothetical protein